MRPRTAVLMYHTAARIWLTLALLSLLLPDSDRLVLWLPIHLALAGAISVAISGAMQNFVYALTATRGPSAAWVVTQLVLVDAGAGLIALGRPTGHPGLVVAGGTLFLAGIALLGVFVWNARRLSLHRRHTLPIAMYLAAITAMLTGGILGAVMGSNTVHSGEVYVALRRAHMLLNVLGWISLTISGTLVTLLPTVLRVRMPAWRGGAAGALLAAGIAGLSAGFALRVEPIAGVGALLYAAGVAATLVMVGRVLGVPRRWPVPTAARHLVAGVVWWVAGVLALTVSVLRGPAEFDRFRLPFLAIFVGGWALQTLLGAWQYLLPMATPGHPDERRGFLAATELGGWLQVVALNLGVLLLALHGAGWVPDPWGAVGAGLGLAGGGLALLKAWTFPVISRLSEPSERVKAIWGA